MMENYQSNQVGAAPQTTEHRLNSSIFATLQASLGDDLAVVPCSKLTIVHLSRTLEDLLVAHQLPALFCSSFPESSPWYEAPERYHDIARVAQQVYLFGRRPLPPPATANEHHILLRDDTPHQEWFMIILAPGLTVLLCGHARQESSTDELLQFQMIWSFEAAVVEQALDQLERVLVQYRPELCAGLSQQRQRLAHTQPDAQVLTRWSLEMIRFEEQLHSELAATSRALNAQLNWRDMLTETLVHDLRTPLQGILTALQLLELEATLNPATQEILVIAERSAKQLGEQIHLILHTNQLAAGQFRLSFEFLHLHLFLAAALAPLQPLAQRVGINLRDNRATAPEGLWGDGELLRRVVQNLVGNALKFTQPGGAVTVQANLAVSRDQLELRVRDTGYGIRSTMLPHIFERYAQGTDGDRRGSGLGLYFCRLAVEAHGGTIRADSEVGAGTTITILLPLTPPSLLIAER